MSNSRTDLDAEQEQALIYSTTLGRMHFADFVQLASAEKRLFGFDRYGHTLAVLAPIEAVKILAGREDEMSPHIRAQIKRAALDLLDAMPAQSNLDALASGRMEKAPRAIVELEEIEARRKRRQKRASPSRKLKRQG
jgi:hypothetical protein